MKIISGHQPVYMPWLGFFHKVALADIFVVMDDVQYLQQDWNNRNYIKGGHGPVRLTVPVSLKKSKSKIIRDIKIQSEGDIEASSHWQKKHYLSIRSCYARAPFYSEHAEFIENLFLNKKWEWLHELNYEILKYMLGYLGLETELVIASEFGFQGVKSDLVLDHCLKLNGNICVLGMHGKDYIDCDSFFRKGISLHFQDYVHPRYDQLFGEFESNLSTLDVLMNAGKNSLEILRSDNVTRSELLDAVNKSETPIVYTRRSDHEK
ncbi:WbqC family protein [Desulfovibrio sp. JC010]|uniref:WbqC family protein n=1 Tax=Desulfovibrio sp. JC010 TaxID=2593641 RepID=UPI0013D357F1|nr:WbqC family protein [Desulfovibrio sp. JC010]